MNNRLGFIGIIIHDREQSAEAVNHILHQHAKMFVGRMGIPYKEKNIGVITLIVDATTDEIGALTGRLGEIKGVSVKSALVKVA
ncbi:MAG TPA: iron-only hydrogenase system regulator [Candidatus Omnitrophota bacterium]|nr:iron-only hydrogenase system regulator [Candidatus Omnitrophota bacterium]HQL40708.1 iron-only hydrogenase system regulator [Candidatus Omnitrophota bacterium]